MPRYGVDTSILVRLLTGDPARDYERTKAALEDILAGDPGAEIEASNMVIGEAYFVLQHHYGVSKEEAKAALVSVLTSGLIKPHPGHGVLEALGETSEPGLLDRLIVGEYLAASLVTLTHDRKMARLRGARLLS